MVLHPARPAVLGDPAGLYLGTTAGEVYCSRAAGEHWTRLVGDLPPVQVVVAARVVG